MHLAHRFIGNPNSNNLIIFLHEGLGCIEMWKNFPENLVDKLQCYGLVYDRSGYGKSPGNIQNRSIYYLHEAAYELKQFVQYLDLDHYKISLYGHSDGGSIALIFASLQPKNLNFIITEAAHVFVEKETISGVQAAIEPFKNGKFSGLKKYHGERYKEVFWTWNNIWLDPNFLKWTIELEIESISVPSLIIQGVNDQYGTPNQVTKISNAIGLQAKSLLINNAGHAPHKSHPSEIFKAIHLHLYQLI